MDGSLKVLSPGSFTCQLSLLSTPLLVRSRGTLVSSEQSMAGYPEDDGCVAEVSGDVQSSVAGEHNVSSSLLFLVPFARASLHERDRVVAVWKLRG
jgi:hypothetical protein